VSRRKSRVAKGKEERDLKKREYVQYREGGGRELDSKKGGGGRSTQNLNTERDYDEGDGGEEERKGRQNSFIKCDFSPAEMQRGPVCYFPQITFEFSAQEINIPIAACIL
jgi:hypothetical protein